MIMTQEELNLLLDIKNALSETLTHVKQVYGASAYWQHLDYKANKDNYENWLFRAQQAEEKAETYLKNKR